MAVTKGLTTAVRDADGNTCYLELNNERPMGLAIVANASLDASHRNRFTLINAVCTLTVVAYAGIVVGAEHEFMNNSDSPVTIAAMNPVVLKSLESRFMVSVNGVIVLKYIAPNTFLLCGSLE